MPPRGRPSGGSQGRRRREWEAPLEDVYRFQELDSEDEGQQGVDLDPFMQKNRHFNPDDLFFNGMDPRAWEQRLAEQDDLAYGDDYDYSEEEDDYYGEGRGAVLHLAPPDSEETLVQRVLERIRRARETGEPNVSLSQEELEAYETRILRQQQVAPAVRTPVKSKTSPNVSSSNSAQRSKRTQQTRPSPFTAPKSFKNQKINGWKRPSSHNRAPAPAPAPAPGFMIPGPNGQPTYAPITYGTRTPRPQSGRSTSSPSRPGSRSASSGSHHDKNPSTPPNQPYEPPGAFPSGSPARGYRDITPPNASKNRPTSSASRRSSIPDDPDWALRSSRSRSSSSSIHQLSLQPVTPYQHHTAEPYQYHVPSQSAPSVIPAQTQSPAQPQAQFRRITSSPSDGAYVPLSRRVPVGGGMPRASVQSSYSDPALGYRNSGLRGELGSDNDDDDDDDRQQGVLVDVVPDAGSGYNLQVIKSGASGSSSGAAIGSGGGGGNGSGSGEKRRRRGRR